MKIKLVLLLLLSLFNGGEIHKVARINKAKVTAEKAFKSGNYKEAAKTYQILTDSFKVREEPVLLNKAHCYFHLRNNEEAKKSYTTLLEAKDNSIKSIANNQLGLLAYSEKNPDMARNYFKEALKAFPQNAQARYNFELVSKLLKNQEKKEDKKNKNDQNEKPMEPSAFAKKVKAQAEALSGSYKYLEAYNLMLDGVKKDKSVLYFKDFIDRLKVVSDLSKL